MKNLRSLCAAALLAASVPALAVTNADLIGTAVPQAVSADRTVDVGPNTRWVNVEYGETVNFVVREAGAEKSYTHRFDGLRSLVPLSDIAPGAPAVRVYVDQSDNPLLSSHE